MYRLSKQDLMERATRRGSYPADAQWWGVMTHCGQERAIHRSLGDQGHEARVEELLLPELTPARPGAKGELLFPCYLFIRCRMDDAIYTAICEQKGVYKILGEAWRIPEPIAAEEIGRLRAILAAQERPQMARALRRGQRVEVHGGLMDGMRGIVVEWNAHHVKLQTTFSFLEPGTAVVVKVPREAVRAVDGEWGEQVA